MNQEVLDFLNKNRVCALAVCLPNGSCHNATMHYSHQADPLIIYIQTENTSLKCNSLISGQSTKASIVIGFDEQTMQTLQIYGDIKIVSDKDSLTKIYDLHYTKHPHAEQYKNDPATVFLAFTLAWWRYSDYKNNAFLTS